MSKLLFTDGNKLLSSGNNKSFLDVQMYIYYQEISISW